MHRRTLPLVLALAAATALAVPMTLTADDLDGGDAPKKVKKEKAEKAPKAPKVGGVYAKLELTDAQKEQIAAIQAETKAKMNELKQQEKTQIEGRLTEDQKAELEAMSQKKGRDKADKPEKKPRKPKGDDAGDGGFDDGNFDDGME